METQRKQIRQYDELVFETIDSNTSQSFNFHLKDKACFIYLNQGKHLIITPSELMEIMVVNLSEGTKQRM